MSQEIRNDFMTAIHDQLKVRLTFYSNEDGSVRTRTCAPVDYSINEQVLNGIIRFRFWDYDNPDGNHNLILSLEQIIVLEIIEDHFEVSNILAWKTKERRWNIPRDWGRQA